MIPPFIKSAPVQFPVHDLIRNRWSPRAFADETISDGILRSLFEAARWAPSSFNEQPWRFILARKESKKIFESLLNILSPQNRLFAQHAPVLLLAAAKINHAHGVNRHALHDLGLAVANLTLQATHCGLGLHQMGGFDTGKAREVFAIPDEFEPVTVIAIGFPGDPETLPETLKQKDALPRKRKPFEEFVFENTWNQSSSLFLKKETL